MSATLADRTSTAYATRLIARAEAAHAEARRLSRKFVTDFSAMTWSDRLLTQEAIARAEDEATNCRHQVATLWSPGHCQ